jgi:hypothetical protein
MIVVATMSNPLSGPAEQASTKRDNPSRGGVPPQDLADQTDYALNEFLDF